MTNLSTRRAQDTQAHRPGETAVPAGGGHDHHEAVGVERVDRADLRKIGLELPVQRGAGVGGDQVVDLSPGHTQVEVLEHRIGAVGDPLSADHRKPPATRVVAGELPERALDLPLATLDHAFDHDFAAGTGSPVSGAVARGAGDPRRAPASSRAVDQAIALQEGAGQLRSCPGIPTTRTKAATGTVQLKGVHGLVGLLGDHADTGGGQFGDPLGDQTLLLTLVAAPRGRTGPDHFRP
jgi:hypothetical protein